MLICWRYAVRYLIYAPWWKLDNKSKLFRLKPGIDVQWLASDKPNYPHDPDSPWHMEVRKDGCEDEEAKHGQAKNEGVAGPHQAVEGLDDA